MCVYVGENMHTTTGCCTLCSGRVYASYLRWPLGLH